jgi:galactokinase
VFAPGRVNLIGEHTDYNDGLALAFAIEQGVTVTATQIAGTRITVRAVDLAAEDSFDVVRPQPVEQGRALRPPTGEAWRSFVRGAVAELSAAGVAVPPAHVEISGAVPRGAGLASSAALEVALTLALIALSGASPAPSGASLADRTDLARLCSRIENEWVGARTGVLDQLASLYGQEGHALRIDFRSLDIRAVDLRLGDHELVTLDSGERRGNAASGYNRRREECGRACELLGIESLRDATDGMADRLPEPLNRRVRHVTSANARVDEAASALERHDLAELGRLLDDGHASLRDDYEVSTPAVEAAVARLKRAGALGARVFGGGLGGHVLGLLPPDARPPEGAVRVAPGPGARVLT